jgi:hypothetical protein
MSSKLIGKAGQAVKFMLLKDSKIKEFIVNSIVGSLNLLN